MMTMFGLATILIESNASSSSTSSDDVNFADVNAVVLNVKHRMSSAKLDLRAEKIEQAIDTLEGTRDLIDGWIKSLKDSSTGVEADEGGAEDATAPDRVSDETFRYETTFVPDRCSRKADRDGDYVKLQYVAWVWPDKKMFSSSFHTGSLPVKVVLGGKDHVAGVSLTEGVRGACRGERRNVFVPAAMAFGSKGNRAMSIPKNADLKFSVEIVEIGLTGRGDDDL